MFRKSVLGGTALLMMAAGSAQAIDLERMKTKYTPVENSKDMYEVCAGTMSMAYLNASNLPDTEQNKGTKELLQKVAMAWIGHAAKQNNMVHDDYITKVLTNDINNIQGMADDVRMHYLTYCLEQTQKLPEAD